MSVNPTIRPIVLSDFSQWLPLWEGYNKFYGRSGKTALPEETTQRTWARFFDAYEPVNALVAVSDGQLVGLVHYIFHRALFRYRQPVICRISLPKNQRAAKGLNGAD